MPQIRAPAINWQIPPARAWRPVVCKKSNVGSIRQATLKPFEVCNFVLAPVMAVLPYAAELTWPPGGTAHNPFCFPFNISEQPAASILAGFSREGLPIGLQIIGRRFDDNGVLRAAAAYERATGLLSRRPGGGSASQTG